MMTAKEVIGVALFLGFMAFSIHLIDCAAQAGGAQSWILQNMGINEDPRGCQ